MSEYVPCTGCGNPRRQRIDAHGVVVLLAHRCGEVVHIAGAPIIGKHYVPSCGECAVPPWERCACSVL